MRKNTQEIFFRFIPATAILMILAAFFILAPVASAGLDTSGGQGWSWVHPDPQGEPINAIDFVDASTGYGVTTAGYVVKTEDGGETWTAQLPVNPPACGTSTGSGCMLLGLDFLDANNGWVVGSNGTIMKTTDGGATWSSQSLPANKSGQMLNDVAFFDGSKGVITGENNAFFTVDGGLTWQVSAGPSGDNLNSIVIVNSTTAFAVGNNGTKGVVFRTGTSGSGWAKKDDDTLSGYMLKAVDFTSATNGIAVGCDLATCRNGVIIRTKDGGNTWDKDSSSISKPLFGLDITGTALVAVGGDGTILKTAAGTIWTDSLATVAGNLESGVIGSGTTSKLVDVFFPLDGSTGFASGVAGVVTKTSNDGAGWTLKAGSDDTIFYGSSFIDKDGGWVSGSDGTIIKTVDGGTNWAADANGIPGDMSVIGIQFLDANTGFAVGCQGVGCETNGTDGRIYKYSSGTWSLKNIPSGTKALRSIHMTGSNNGWAVGEGGEALWTSDGGENWNSRNTNLPPDVTLNSVDAFGTDAWAAGQDQYGGPPGTGVIYKYSGAAGTWGRLDPASAPSILTSVDMVNTQVGYAVGGVDKVYKTSNGGNSWQLLSTGLSGGGMVPGLLTSVSFVDGNIGFVAGGGKVVTTIDGGQNWTAEAVGTNATAHLNTIAATSNINVERIVTYVAGENATVLKQTKYINASSPFGSLDSVSVDYTGQISLSGWAIDPSITDPIKVHVYVNGQWGGEFTANGSRPDVGSAYPGYGDNHGFSASATANAASNTVCVYGIDVNPEGVPGGNNALLGCKVVNVAVDPFGNLEGVSAGAPGEIDLSGWAIDPNTTGSIPVHVYVNGQWGGEFTADGSRPDVGGAFPGYGDNHGFSGTVAARAASNTVCAYGINTVPGDANPLLGCKVVNVAVDPFGNLEGVSAGAPGEIDLSGWAIDPSITGPIQVHVYVNGQWGGEFTADGSRPDVGDAFPAYGDNHGFSGTVAARAASNTVCAYGINTGAGDANPLLGCKVVNVAVDPFGDMNTLSLAGPNPSDPSQVLIDVDGWAIDPNTTGPILVHIYVNGQWGDAFTADGSRPDVGDAFPAYGDNHGFSGTVAAAKAGSYTVCAYGINDPGAPGNNALLGCIVAS